MAKLRRLTAEEREFFSMVSQAVFTNPFTDERVNLDAKITGMPSKVTELARIEKLREVVGKKVQQLETEGRGNINLFSGHDRLLVETSFLFDFFHQFLEKFDQFILDQIDTGDKPLTVPFTRQAFSHLNRRGFSDEAARRYFELTFQLRRAYFFIDRSLVGRSSSMKELRRKLWNNVFTHDLNLYNNYLWDRMEDFSTLVLGETGTGKGAAAAAIGRSGFIPFDEKKVRFVESFTRSFLALNLSQFPENLIESELFGHKKGAFTGAVEDYEGVFDRCSPNGAIFLDEIGEVSIPVQIKLLQVLQERVFSSVGSHDKHRFNGRVIAATNRPIDELRREKMMRHDFYYRLCSDIITVPPLRQRIREDGTELDDLLALLVERMVGQPSPDVARMVRTVVERSLGKDYPWPGNVRELEQCVRSVLLNQRYEGEREASTPDLCSRLVQGIQNGNMEMQQLLAGYCYLLYQRHGTYEEVARRLKLDRRTAKKYVDEWTRTGDNA
ncbi:MAG: sigma-54-dependent Fis family transcriptional regulator [Deltaproteobacteria bacterium]|nr:MAG: sigma-54-dependent Fis family transcriptional regulator [Deltaproteobacteria bacterium]